MDISRSPDDVDPAADTATADTPSWRDELPDDLRDDATVANYKTPGDLAKAYVNLNKTLENRIQVPGEGATPEEMGAFYARLGRPDSPDGYEMPGELPDNVTVDDSIAKDWFKAAHEMGLNRQQAARSVRFQVDAAAAAQRQQAQVAEKAAQASLAELKDEWGAAFDEKTQMARAAMRRLEDGGAKGLSTVIPPEKLHEYPALARAFAAIGKYMTSDEILGRGSVAEFVHSPAEAAKMLTQKRGDAEFMAAVRDTGHPNHAGASAEYEKLALQSHYTET